MVPLQQPPMVIVGIGPISRMKILLPRQNRNLLHISCQSNTLTSRPPRRFFIGAPGMARSAIDWCCSEPHGGVRMTWRWKSSIDPTRGTISRTARVSIVRWNLKEAAGKTLARRTEIAYEAVAVGKKANIFKARYLYGSCGRKCGGHKCEGHADYPGRSVLLP